MLRSDASESIGLDWEEFRARFAGQLNEQQISAVRETEGPVLLLAVPGSGKTTVLVTRLGCMILVKNIDPASILTLTYTVAATKDMRNRFAAVFGEEAASGLQFRTINGICAQILYRFSRMTGKEQFALTDNEKDSAGLLGRVIAEVTGNWPSEAELKEVRTQISYIKNSMLTAPEIEELDGKTDLPVSLIYPAYQRRMREERRMDYDDQLTASLAVLRNFPQVLREYRGRYRYFLVDEAQDTSKIQHEIIALLAGETENLFMVGDEDQSIYGFRAAYPEALLEFDGRHPGARVLLMEQNYRSTPQIVSAADRFIGRNTLRHEKHMRTDNADGPEIRFVDLKGRGAQYTYLLKVAADASSETAVLYRDNDSMIPLADLLEREGVDFRLRNADYLFFSSRIVLDIRDIGALAGNPADTEAFLRIYYKIGTYLTRESAAAACRLSEGKNMPVLDAALCLPGLPKKTAKNLRTLRGSFAALSSDRADEAIGRILGQMGYGAYLKRSGISDGKAAILRILAKREYTLGDLFSRLDYLQVLLRSRDNTGTCPFILSTVHASKGLEYDSVYLMDVMDGIFPQEAAGGSRKGAAGPEYPEEERRLFYVAVTRAKKNLCIFSLPGKSGFVSEFRRLAAAEKAPKAVISPGQAAAMMVRAKEKPEKNRRKESDPGGLDAFTAKLGEGVIVSHADYGEGVITAVTDRQVRIRFGNAEKSFLLRILYEKDLLEI